MSLAYDEVLLRDPGLLLPGRAPLLAVEAALDNPLARDVSWAYLFHGGNRGAFNRLAFGSPKKFRDRLESLTPVTPNWDIVAPGMQGMYAGSATSASITRDANVGAFATESGDYKGAFSLLVVGAPRSGTVQTLLQCRNAAGNYENVTCTVNRYYDQGATGSTASNGTICFYTNSMEFGNNARGIWALSAVNGRAHSWLMTKSAGYYFRLFEDGKLIGEVDETARTPVAICNDVCSLALGGPTDTGFTTGTREPLFLLAEWDRELTIAEGLSITHNPWQMVKPK